jgi:hypothetical protein
MLLGFTSRWMTPDRCAFCNPWHTCIIRSSRLRPEIIGKRHPLEQLHHDERLAVVFAQIEHGHDVAVRELARRPGFAIEPLAHLRVIVEIGLDDLDGHATSHLRVVGRIDDAHGAPADARGHAIAADVLRQRGGRRQAAVGRARHQSTS